MHFTGNAVKCVSVYDVQYVEKLYFPVNFFAPSFTLTNICLEYNECTRFHLRRNIYNVNFLEFYQNISLK